MRVRVKVRVRVRDRVRDRVRVRVKVRVWVRRARTAPSSQRSALGATRAPGLVRGRVS